MKATYDNSFCMDNNCIHYFEDMCMLCMTEKGTEIEPLDDLWRESKECKEFRAGTYLVYEVDFSKEDFKGED